MASTHLTFTIGEMVITDVKANLPTQGQGTGSITFQAYDSAGDDSVITWA
jgi:hypothetical protein